MTAADFWRNTPGENGGAIRSHLLERRSDLERTLAGAHQSALMQRQKRIPKLAAYLRGWRPRSRVVTAIAPETMSAERRERIAWLARGVPLDDSVDPYEHDEQR